MACAKASTPVAAAIFWGRFLIISGSSRTLSAIIASLTMPTFSSCSGTATIALGVASLPVPAVVGIISVGQHFLRGRALPAGRARSSCRPKHTGQLGGIHHAAAAHGQNHIRALGPAGIHQLLDLAVARLRRQVIQHTECRLRLLKLLQHGVQQAGAADPLVCKDSRFFTDAA